MYSNSGVEGHGFRNRACLSPQLQNASQQQTYHATLNRAPFDAYVGIGYSPLVS